MACYSGPEIVNDGLVLHLDAANSRSYPGSGTTWYDLSGNGNHVSLYNSPSYDNGFIRFDGSNQYARTTSTLNLSVYDKVTFEIIFRIRDTNTPSGMAFEHSNNWNTNTMGFGFLPNSSGGLTYVSNRHHTNQSSAVRYDFNGLIATDVVSTVITWGRNNDSDGRTAYINSIRRGNISGGNATSSTYPLFRNDYLYISSRGGSSIYARHDVYSLKVYGDKKISSEQARQNFEATRTRYGI